MNRLDKIQELKERVFDIKRQLRELDKKYLKGFAPKEYGKEGHATEQQWNTQESGYTEMNDDDIPF